MSHERRQNRTTWVSTSSFEDFGHPCPIFLSGKIGQALLGDRPNSLGTSPSYPDFCIALLGDRPEILSGTSPYPDFCIAYNKAMSHMSLKRQNRTTWVSTSSFGGLWTPLPYFPLRENWARVSKAPPIPDFCIALLGDRPEILSGRPLK